MKIIDQIRVAFPQADELAFERLFCDEQSNLFAGKQHRALYDKSLTIATLYLAEKYAQKIGYDLRMSQEEKKLFRKFTRLIDSLE